MLIQAVEVVAALSWPILSRIPLVGDLSLSPHGLGAGLGFLVGARMLIARVGDGRAVLAPTTGPGAVARHEVVEKVTRLLGWALLGGIVGARLFWVLNHLGDYRDQPLQALAVWEGGATFLGGALTAIVIGWVVAARWGLRRGALLDAAMPGLATGLLLGRLGDLAIGDHLGAPTDFVLGWQCAGDFNPVGGPNALGMVAAGDYPSAAVSSGAIAAPTLGCFATPVHQTALYDALAVVAVLTVVVLLERRIHAATSSRSSIGLVAAATALTYGLARIVGDFARLDRRWSGLTASQWTMVVVVLGVTTWLVLRRRDGRARA